MVYSDIIYSYKQVLYDLPKTNGQVFASIVDSLADKGLSVTHNSHSVSGQLSHYVCHLIENCLNFYEIIMTSSFSNRTDFISLPLMCLSPLQAPLHLKVTPSHTDWSILSIPSTPSTSSSSTMYTY